MKRFFSRNIDRKGRLARAIWGLLLVIGGVVACGYNVWLSVALVVAGGFALFEAVRGWCVMRACGMKTKF